MRESFTLGGGNIVADVGVEPHGIYGTGQAEFPVIGVQLRMTMRCPDPNKGLFFRELRARFSAFDGPPITMSDTTRIGVLVKSGETFEDRHIFLQIPIDHRRLAVINRLRKGGDVKMRLDFELMIDELFPLVDTKSPLRNIAWGFLYSQVVPRQMSLTILRSEWTDRVLAGTGFGKTYLLELPTIPLAKCKAVKASFDALQEAQKLEGEGYYNEAVAKCRIALEPFFEMVDKPDGAGRNMKVPALKASWELRLGKATYDWLNASLVAVKGAANKSHHLSSSSFEQTEAQMLLIVTSALVAYAIKTQPESERSKK